MPKRTHSKEQTRCPWAKGEQYIQYHDQEWGVPVHDDRHFFELLVLEGAQAGLSWITVLKKRDNYRKAFDQFDVQKVARYSQKKIETLVQNPEIIRNRLKIESAVKNAEKFLAVQEEFGSFDKYIWSFVEGRPIQNVWRDISEIPAVTPESDFMSHDLKRRGFRFVGSTICYALMQSAGLVNDHLTSCFRHSKMKSC
ncbi:MAG: DNA-3-methyladenine glycosylase I [Planctomycetes bacterium]|nr:DNA-3-methyladenine glycosylase I [Planctomycetota bacterium]